MSGEQQSPETDHIGVMHARGPDGGLCGAGTAKSPALVTAASNNVIGVTCKACLALLSPVDYVVGFAFDTRGRVALIRKNRPAWQAGRLNGIGGHVEPGEHPDAAMSREFHEETGTRLDGWERYAVMDFPGARIYFYRLRGLHPIRLDGLRTTTDETVCVVGHRELGQAGVIPNLTWLIPLAAYTADTYEVVHVQAAMAEVIDAPEHVCRPESPTAPK